MAEQEKSVVEKQKEQLARYEKRLRDVVTAYKGLAKEKEALEASLKILSDKSSKQKSTEQQQFKTLSDSLSVLTAEKSRIEANFQADKRKLREEVEMLQNSVQDLAESEKTLKYENESLRLKLISEKQNKQLEQQNLHQMIKELQTQHESRVAILESRLTELSVTVGEYDRHRNTDQQAIQHLKDQILELENKAARHVSEGQLEKQDSPEKSEDKNSVTDIDVHVSCREQCDILLKELEQVKQLQSVQHQHGARSEEANIQYEKLKSQNHNLQERINSLCKKINQTENELSLQKQSKKAAVDAERERCTAEMLVQKRQQEALISGLEDQLRILRERSLHILEEKDLEISKIRNALKNISPTTVLAGEIGQTTNPDNEGPESLLKSSENPQLFHFSQENARNVVESTILRKQNFKLETQVRELNRKCADATVTYEEKVSKLQQEIERLSLGQSREGANLEYLKNVVLRFLTCDDENNKRHMLTAICTVLRFTKSESKAVLGIKK